VHTDFVDHKGKIVVITGASGQIGRELCRQYLLHNALVIGLDINKEFIADFKTDKFYFENLDSDVYKESFSVLINFSSKKFNYNLVYHKTKNNKVKLCAKSDVNFNIVNLNKILKKKFFKNK
jgi:dihydrodipicolinate reductase